ncbi:MAG TPA: zf-HC2 domain-containing protein [Gaiellaceae bacterium]|nr:zf-HC2 domain-containing protein [Gaiellaceae bacterium]
MDDELTCKELVEVVTDYLEGTMDYPDRRRFEEHLVYCEGCSTYLAQMRQTIGLVGRLSEDDVPEAARDELLEVYRAWKGEQG